MASILKVDALQGVTAAGSILVTGEGNSTTTNLQQGLAKAWFDAPTWASVADSLNISSISDDAAGRSIVTFATAMGNGDYICTGISQDADGIVNYNDANKIAASCDVRHYGGLAGTADYVDSATNVIFHGDLA